MIYWLIAVLGFCVFMLGITLWIVLNVLSNLQKTLKEVQNEIDWYKQKIAAIKNFFKNFGHAKKNDKQ